MADESRLSIVIDSRSAEKGAESLSDALDRVEKSGDEAAASTSHLSQVTVSLGSNMSKTATATVASLSRIERATESTSVQMTALVSRSVALENAMAAVGQGVGRLDSGIAQSNTELGQLNAQVTQLVSTFSTFSQGQSAINAQLTRIASNMSQAADEARNLDQATSRAGRSARATEQSIDEERAGLARLLGQIDPTVAALDRLDEMQARLQRYHKLGLVDADTVADASKRLQVMRDALGDTDDGMRRTGQSAKQLQANLRMLPAQITDITVSLASGQQPLTVFLQQGGQLKDMFGGIGPAARAVGGYVLGLVNPFTLAAAAVGTLAVAYYEGSQETEVMTNAIIANGNAAGTSTTQLSALAKAVGQGNITIGQASSVLTALAASGNRLTDLYGKMATGAIAWSQSTGQSIKDVVANYAALEKDPLAAIKKLDGELNILTASQYANIQSLQERGQKEEAARIATEIYADTIASRSSQMAENLGVLERSWNSLSRAAKGAWDSMLNVGRSGSIDDQIADIERKLAQPKFGLLTSDADFKKSKDLLREQLDFLQSKKEAQQYDEKYFAQQSKLQEAGKRGLETINTIFTSAQSQTEKLGKQLKDLDSARADALKAGGFSAEEETKYAAARKNIEQQIADIKSREAKKNAPKAGSTRGQNAGVREADNTASRLLAQYDPAAQAARTLTKEESQLQLALSKGKITREEYGKALAQASQNYAAAIKGAQGLTAAEQYQAQMERQLLIQREQYAAQAAAVGMGEKEGARYMQRLQLEQQTNDRLLQLQTQYAAAKGEQQKRDIQAQIEIERQALPMRQAALEEGYRQLHAAMLNPINGWTAAVQNFGAQAADVAGQTQSVFEGAFNTITGQLTSNIMNLDLSLNSLGNTGKLMAKELVGGFVKIGVQMAANAALSSVLQSAEVVKAGATGTAIAGAYAPAAGMASIASFGGAAVAGAAAIATALPQVLSLVGFADGGFVSGPGTGRSDSIPAMLSNGEFVVNAAATKRNRALLESINSNERIAMPRGSSSGDQGGPVVVQQNVEILNYSQNQVETRTGQDGQLQVIIRSVEEYMTNSVYSGTGSFNRAVESAYGLKRQGR